MLPDRWAIYISAGWALCSVFAFARIAFGATRIVRLRKSCTVIEPSQLAPEIQQTLAQFQSRRAVSLCTSEAVSVPAAIGFFRPIVVIPTPLLNELPAADLNQVLLHELAHLQYWDDWTNLGQKVLRAALFFHPAAWWMDRQLTIEREQACDDFVVHQTGDSKAYARCLTSLAEKSFARRSLTLAQAVVSRARQTSARVSRLLKAGSPVGGKALIPALSMMGVLFASGAAIRTYTPTLITFQDEVPAAVGASAEVPAIQPTLAKYTLEPRQAITKARKAKALAPSGAAVAKSQRPIEEPVEQLARANNVERTRQPRAILVSERTSTTYAVPVGRSFVAVMNDDGDGNTTVQFFQFTVWRVTTQPPASIEKKT